MLFKIFFSFFFFFLPIQKISVKMTAKTLHQGKSATAKADVFYQSSGGLMVTHFTSPAEMVIITNAYGEYKNYDVVNNTVILSQGIDFSSKNSFFYFFLSGKTQDMGLSALGYKLQSTKMEDGMVITTWLPPEDIKEPLSKVEIVHENFLPIFMGFFDKDGKPTSKIYYSNYQDLQDIKIPMNTTEFEYLADGDSIISRRSYSDIKINNEVDNTYLNFKIPANAKLIKQ